MHRVETTLQMARPARLRQWLYPLWHREIDEKRRFSVAVVLRSRRTSDVPPPRNGWQVVFLEIGSGQETYTRDEFLAQSPTMTFWRSEISTGGYGRQASVSAGFYALLCDVTCMSFRIRVWTA